MITFPPPGMLFPICIIPPLDLGSCSMSFKHFPLLFQDPSRFLPTISLGQLLPRPSLLFRGSRAEFWICRTGIEWIHPAAFAHLFLRLLGVRDGSSQKPLLHWPRLCRRCLTLHIHLPLDPSSSRILRTSTSDGGDDAVGSCSSQMLFITISVFGNLSPCSCTCATRIFLPTRQGR